MIDCDVHVANQLGVLHVRVKVIVAHIDAIKVDVTVEEDICPQTIGEVGAFWLDNKIVLGMLYINEVVLFEHQGPHNISIQDSGHDGNTGPGIEGLISNTFQSCARGWTIFVVEHMVDSRGNGSFNGCNIAHIDGSLVMDLLRVAGCH